jgi:leucyl-tRNA synthetase
VRHEALELIVQMLAPIAPHICHVLWRELGHKDALIDHPWPHADAQALVQDRIEVVVQVNGKLRSKVEVGASASKDEISAAALADATIQKWIEGKQVRKVIVPPGNKLVNVVV